jgi:membrane protein insertase Oxa1/YidC/SpoIIIJ
VPDAATLTDLHQHATALADLADAAAAAASTAAADSSNSGDFLGQLSNTLETVLKTFQQQLDRLNVPYSYGWSIVLLTLCVKVVTLPLTKQQVRQRSSSSSSSRGNAAAAPAAAAAAAGEGPQQHQQQQQQQHQVVRHRSSSSPPHTHPLLPYLFCSKVVQQANQGHSEQHLVHVPGVLSVAMPQ